MTALERDILATLEEAGEDDLAALLNTVRECRGLSDELEAYRKSLVGLLKRGLLEFGRYRDKVSLRWVSLPKSEAAALLEQLGPLLRWSDFDHLWEFYAEDPRIEVLLSDAGFVAAREVLSEDGWPVRRPWRDL